MIYLFLFCFFAVLVDISRFHDSVLNGSVNSLDKRDLDFLSAKICYDLWDKIIILESLGIKGFEVDAHREVNGFLQVHAFVVVLLEHAGCGLAAATDRSCFPATVVSGRISLNILDKKI